MAFAWYRLGALALGALVACGGKSDAPPATKDSVVAPPSGDEPRKTLMLVGTSLTAGYGLDPADAWSAHLQTKIDSAGLPFTVVNAGVSGETSAGALRRTDWLFSRGPIAVLLVETGANDGLRGLSVDSLRANLETILTRADALSPKPTIIVAGMEALPNLGRAYVERFRSLYPAVAKAHGAIYLPFLLDGVAGVDSLNQADGIHPNAAGARRVAENVWKAVEPVLRAVMSRGS